MKNTFFVNKAINSHFKFCNNIIAIRNIQPFIAPLVLSLLLICNLVNAQQQNNPSKDTTTFDAKSDSGRTLSGKKIINGKAIETTVGYKSSDSIVYDMENRLIYLYGNSEVKYGNRTLSSDRITIDYTKNLVTSIGTQDSIGKTKGRPLFAEGSEKYVADKIVFNFQTKKGVVYGAETRQGEGFVYGEAIKKNGDDELFVGGATYTTCDRKHPHFGFMAKKIKIINNKKILSGPGQLQLGGTPLPLFLPFGFFPYPKKRSSGILMPAIGGSSESGNYLRQLGLYLAINDYLGLKIMGDMFFNGGFRANSELEYRVNYRFAGTFSYSRNAIISGFGETKKPEPITNNISWTHNQLAKRRGRFTARVNISTNGYNRQIPGQVATFAQQDFNSSVNYSRNFPKTGISMNVASTYTNNSAAKTAQVQLPTVNFGIPNIKPFKNLSVNNKFPLVQGINISPSLEFRNIIYNKTYYSRYGDYFNVANPIEARAIDSLMLNKDFKLSNVPNFMSYGGSWGLSLFTSAKIFKYLNITPQARISGNLYDRYLSYAASNMDTTSVYYKVNRGLYAPFTFNYGASASTILYGMIKPGILGVKAIRHVMTPSVTYTLQPRVAPGSGLYDYLFQQDPRNPEKDLARAQNLNNNFVYGAPSVGRYSEIVSFNITNSIEAKLKSKSDTAKSNDGKKIKLIENLSFSGNYAISNDSFKLSNITGSAVTRLFNKISINGSMTFDPYQYEIIEKEGKRTAKRIDKYIAEDYNISSNNVLARISNTSFNVSTSLNPNWKLKNHYTPEEEALFRIYPHLRYVDFSLPWNVGISYAFSDTKNPVGPAVTRKNATLSGNITLMDTWKFTFNTSYDLDTKLWGGHRIGLIKDLHCWQIQFNWMPQNTYASFDFKLTAKANTLKGFEPIQKTGRSAF